MLENPLISVVVPSFNQGSFIEQTLVSIINQSYKNYQIVVIDGGSTDNTIDVIKKYQNDIFYWVSEPDKGQSDALCKGFNRCAGDIFFWLCSDDVVLPNTFAFVAQCFETMPELDLLYGDTAYLYPDGTVVRKPRINYDFPIMLNAFNIIAQPSCFFSSKIYKRTGGVNISLNYAMDYDLFIRFGPTLKWARTDEILSHYRIHPSSKTVNETKKFAREFKICRESYKGRDSRFIDTALWYIYTLKVVLRFLTDRKILKLRYDRKKYINAAN